MTNLATKKSVPKNLAIIVVLLGKLVDKGLEYKHLFEKMDLELQKPRVKDYQHPKSF